MNENPKPKKSRTSSKRASALGASPTSEEGSINAYNWHARFMENVRSSNSRSSLQKQKEQRSRIGISAELPFVDSEK